MYYLKSGCQNDWYNKNKMSACAPHWFLKKEYYWFDNNFAYKKILIITIIKNNKQIKITYNINNLLNIHKKNVSDEEKLTYITSHK